MAFSWVVVGGSDKGGIIVREGRDTTSAQLPERLATGAVVEECARVGDRLQFRKCSGEGPETGWVSVRVGAKELLERQVPSLPEKVPESVLEVLTRHAIALGAEEIREAEALRGGSCLDALLRQIGERRWVLLGEATHGTHEFYSLRAAVTRRLVEERGFRTVVVEGDWSACFRVNRWLARASGEASKTFPSPDQDVAKALSDFGDTPAWMWRNQETRELLEWLAAFNREATEAVRFYGLDLQGSLKLPAEEVLRYAEVVDPSFAAELRGALAPFLACSSPRELGKQLAEGQVEDGQGSVQAGELQAKLERLLAELQRRHLDDLAFLAPVEEALNAEQSLEVLLSGQEYYRKHFSDAGVTWNLRDQHMASTVLRLAQHLSVHSLSPPNEPPPGVVIWAHNSHIGDARACSRSSSGEHWNLGHMVRETFGRHATFLLGFSTHHGEVHAAPDWNQAGQDFCLGPFAPNSWEEAMHTQTQRLRKQGDAAGLLWQCGDTGCTCPGVFLRHRLVGVVYRPEAELECHTAVADLSEMYDAILHVDVTSPLVPEL